MCKADLALRDTDIGDVEGCLETPPTWSLSLLRTNPLHIVSSMPLTPEKANHFLGPLQERLIFLKHNTQGQCPLSMSGPREGRLPGSQADEVLPAVGLVLSLTSYHTPDLWALQRCWFLFLFCFVF